ncbi:MAG: hypothetical protein LDL07_04935 [Desulfarculus sp.]|nr:hypothetical protein [Desulfarculus sp.]
MSGNKSCNPSRHFGRRNLYCPHYASCLDVAVSHAWHTFSCGQCQSRNLGQKPRVDDMEMDAQGWEEIWSQADGFYSTS